MAKKNGVPLGEEVVPQVERYYGNDVLGMEQTTARPLHRATGANPDIPLPGKPWPESLCHYAQVKGKKVWVR